MTVLAPSRQRQLVADSIDVRATLRPLAVYGRDPTHRAGPNWFAKAVLTPAGPGTMRIAWRPDGSVGAEAWGDGAEWLLDRAPHWIGLHDDVAEFDPGVANRRIAELWRRRPGIRMCASGVVWQDLVAVVLGQRVTTQEASRSWSRMVHRWGEVAPGPCEVRLPPTPEVVGRLSYVDLHRINVDRNRAEAIIRAARRANRLEEAASMTPADALTRLTALRGLGVWTATSVIGISLGDADTIVLRDYGLPTMVNFAFTGDSTRLRADQGADEVMCRHLAPWSGDRQRIIRLIFTVGASPARRAPRAVNPDIRRL